MKEKAIEEAESISEAEKKDSMDEVLVAFCSVEKGDESDTETVAVKTADEIMKVASTVRTNSVIIYPYAHLSSALAPPSAAIPLLRRITQIIASEKFEVRRSPFGYYKSFKLECKGHPLAELSRSVTADKQKEKTAQVESEYMVLDTEGKLRKPEDYLDYPESEFKSLVLKEALRKELSGGKPKFLDYCRKFGIEWEPYSDVGHMRYGPEGTLLFDLISEYAWQQANAIGIPLVRVRGTNMFDLAIKPVREHAKLFGDRLYEISLDEKRFVLRYAACHQQFAMVKDWSLSYRQLPFGTFEVADSYRLEQSGELLLCFRVRKLHMPDLHLYCKDVQDAKELSIKVHDKIYSEIRALGREYVSIYNTTKEFFEANREFFMQLVKVEQKPILLNFLPEGIFYWVLNVEYTIIDDLNRPREIATFQIDVGNAERFNIAYTDSQGMRQYPAIIHTAIIGTIERYLFTLLDCAVKAENRGEKPGLPLWLSPTQLRIVPITAHQMEHASLVAAELEQHQIRVDIDDREETLQKRIRDAEISWVPYVMVIGQKESGAKEYPIRIRGEGRPRVMTMEDIVSAVKDKTKSYPFIPLPLPRLLSARPGYRRV